MKNLCWAAILGGLFISSCSTDFDVTAEWQDITIVYALLDQSDTAQYIKVGKAFLDDTTSAYEIAQIADSLYYDELTVELLEYKNNQLVKTIPLEKVDGNLEGYVKDTGIFALAPNILYKTKEKLNQDSRYDVVVTEPDNGKQITSSTAIINDFIIYRPETGLKINLQPEAQYLASWLSAQDGFTYGLIVRFYYREYRFDNPTQYEMKYVDWTNFSNMRTTSETGAGGIQMTYNVDGDNFYTFLSNNIPVDPDKFRMADHYEFRFSVGGETLDIFNQVTVAQEGLTSGQALPTYTNIENGLGLFSSRFHKNIIDIPIDAHNVDTLACYSLTRSLNFLKSDSSLCP